VRRVFGRPRARYAVCATHACAYSEPWPGRPPDECTSNALKRRRHIPHDELGLEMEHAKPQRLEPSITASVRTEPPSVIRPVHLDDEAAAWGEKVDDVLAQHDLPSESDSELAAGQPSPEASF